MSKRWITHVRLAAAMGLLMVPVQMAAHGTTSAAPPDWVGGQEAVERLGARLPAVAARNDVTAAQLRAHLLGDPTLFVDERDYLLYIEPTAEASSTVDPSIQATLIDPSAALTLHSRPGSSKVIYLDFDGETVANTAWNEKTGGACSTGAYDSDLAPSTFSQAELAEITGVWARVAEDYAHADVDVTTVDPGQAAIERSSTADLNYGTRVLITNSKTLCPNGKTLYASICTGGCGGIAYVGVFDHTSLHSYYQPAFVFQNGVGSGQKNLAEAASHEAGHNLGLGHDGTPTSGYYTGHGSWAPIMGVGYYEAITQWSKGEYTGANNTQDDFAVMQANGALLLTDDHPESSPQALTTSASISGLISTRTDVDVFSITVSQNTAITVTASPTATSPNLDIALTLRGFGSDIVSDPPSGSTSNDGATGLDASVSATVPAGTYTVRIDGVGFGSPLDTGYSDYASIGAYSVSLIATTAAEPPPPAPSLTLSVRAYKVKGQKRADLTWNGVAGEGYTISRNGTVIRSTDASTTSYTDSAPKALTSATYQVCSTGTSATCSNAVTVSWG